MTKKPEEKNMIDLANEAKNAVYESAGISDTEKLETIEAEQKGERKIEKLEKIANESKGIGFKGIVALFTGITASYLGVVTFGLWGLDVLCRHNKENISKYSYSITKVEGPFFNKTELTISNEEIEVTTSGMFKKYKSISDRDSDRKVDRIYISGEESLYRDKDYEEHKTKFLEVDKEFQEQLEKFKPEIEAWKESKQQN